MLDVGSTSSSSRKTKKGDRRRVVEDLSTSKKRGGARPTFLGREHCPVQRMSYTK